MSKPMYFADDRPRDLSKYLDMSKEELEAEIIKIEAKEANKNRNQIKQHFKEHFDYLIGR